MTGRFDDIRAAIRAQSAEDDRTEALSQASYARAVHDTYVVLHQALIPWMVENAPQLPLPIAAHAFVLLACDAVAQMPHADSRHQIVETLQAQIPLQVAQRVTFLARQEPGKVN